MTENTDPLQQWEKELLADPLARAARRVRATPQNQPQPGVANQIPNAAGGYVYEKDLWTKVEDFLILGVPSNGTYYTTGDKLATANMRWLRDAVRSDGGRVVSMITDIATELPSRALKPRPYLFALAMCLADGDPATKQAVKAVFAEVVRATDHLSMFFGYFKDLGGKPGSRGGTSLVTGRADRAALASWFTAGTTDQVAWKALKARQRKTPQGETLTLRDVLRVAHPKAGTPGKAALFGWLAGKTDDDTARREVPAIDRYLRAQAVTTAAQAVEVVRDLRVPWEFLPSQVLTDPAVWAELVSVIGMTALVRNLPRMTGNGAIGPFTATTAKAAARLGDADAVVKARLHPADLWLASRVYAAGQAQPNPKAPARTWTPAARITDALDVAYEASFGSVTPSGKRLIVAIDSSGSMTYNPVQLGGTRLGPAYEVANAMAVILARTEPDTHFIDVDTRVHASKVTARTNLRDIPRWRPSGGGTDMSVPFQWALQQHVKADGFVIFTDNETWAGSQHPQQALAAYRQGVNPDTRVIVVSMTPAGYSIGDPHDEGVLQVAGLDGQLPKLITGFIR